MNDSPGPERLRTIALELTESAAFRSKCDIGRIAACVDRAPAAALRWREQEARIFLGDDTAAIPDGGGYLLLAAEGILPAFVERDPYFAGWSSVMVNVSDVAAMGGFPIAVVDVLFHPAWSPVERVFAGIRDACRAYGVPLVGGHTTRLDGGPPALAVAVVGRAEHLMTSFGARPGDVALLGIDLRGAYRPGLPFWDATEGRSAASLRGDLEAVQGLGQPGMVHACKDVSNAGIAGTFLMMLESSGVGGVLELDRLPRPPDVDIGRWLHTFPSYAFILSVPPDHAEEVRGTLSQRGLACEAVGRVDATPTLRLTLDGEQAVCWDLAERPFTGFRPPESR